MIMELLKSMFQHRTVVLIEDFASDLDDVVRVDADDVAVERGVVDLAEREAVGHNRFAAGHAVKGAFFLLS